MLRKERYRRRICPIALEDSMHTKHRLIILSALILICLCAPALAGELMPASLFTDNMVLQRESKVAVWGTAQPGQSVAVTLAGTTARAKADQAGKWSAYLRTGAAGGPYEMTISDGTSEKVLKNVMLGEVWFCAGQSNMAATVADAKDKEKEIAAGDDYPQIRLYSVSKWGSFAAKPQDNAGGKWLVCSADTVTSFSAVGYFFGRALADTTLKGVPIGLIDAGRGATRIESWIDRGVLAKHFNMADMRDSAFGATISSCYNGMVYPVMPYGIRGVLWYQGESNASRPNQYVDLFRVMVKDWRKRFGQGELPFLTVQLPGYDQKFDDDYFTDFREAQAKCVKEVPNSYMAVTIDLGEPKDVHPKNKQDVGLRLALIARAKVYRENDIVYSGPVFQSQKIQGNRIRLTFRHANGRLVDKDGRNLQTFEIAGKDMQFKPATARIDGENVTVFSEEVRKPKYVRYAWSPYPKVDLYNAASLPAAPFRTDKEKVEDQMKPPARPQAAPSLGTK